MVYFANAYPLYSDLSTDSIINPLNNGTVVRSSSVACGSVPGSQLMVANENSGEQKMKPFKVRERERGPSQTLLIFPRSPAARRTNPLTEGLEQATSSETS